MHLFIPPTPLPRARKERARVSSRRPSRRPPLARASDENATISSWQEELRLLLDPSLNTGAKQVLLQDLAKRAPQVLGDCRCKSALDGIADVARQVSDVLPDLLANGPRYAARAAESFPSAMSNISNVDMSAGMPSSPEEVGREIRNIFNKTPEGVPTPDYEVLHKGTGYEIRRYPDLIIATSGMVPNADSGEATEVEYASAMSQSFRYLAGYLFGKNKTSTAMKMTTPVVLEKGVPEETMSFIIGEYQNIEDVPATVDESVSLQKEPGRVYAASEFTGFVTKGEAKRQREQLLTMLRRDGISPTPAGETAYKCMVYNGPSTIPNLRRNDMMIEVIYPKAEDATQ